MAKKNKRKLKAKRRAARRKSKKSMEQELREDVSQAAADYEASVATKAPPQQRYDNIMASSNEDTKIRKDEEKDLKAQAAATEKLADVTAKGEDLAETQAAQSKSYYEHGKAAVGYLGGKIHAGAAKIIVILGILFGFLALIFNVIVAFIPGLVFAQPLYNSYMGGTTRIIISLVFLLYFLVGVYQFRGLFVAIALLSLQILPASFSFVEWAIVVLFAGLIWFRPFTRVGLQRIEEEKLGLLPILIFYLDIGLIALITQRFDFTVNQLVRNMVLFMPWWAFFALFIIEEDNWVYNILKVAGVIWIIAIVISGTAISLTGDKLLPSLEELTQAQEKAVKEFGDVAISPFENLKITYSCSLSTIQKPGDKETCVQRSTVETKCGKIYKSNSPEYTECFDREFKVLSGQTATGTIDKSKLATKIEFKKTSDFPSKVEQRDLFGMPMDVTVNSPLKPVDIEFSCSFKKDKDLIPGVVEPALLSQQMGKSLVETVTCTPSKAFASKGNYEVTFNAKVSDIETSSSLRRVLIGDDIKKDDKKKSALLKDKGLTSKQESDSPDDFAVYSFKVGSPSEYPLLDNRETHFFVGNVVNKASGKIVKVSSVDINLFGGVKPSSACLQKFSFANNKLSAKPASLNALRFANIKKGGSVFPVTCRLEFDSSLRMADDQTREVEFTSLIKYDYITEKKERFEVISYDVPTPTIT